MRLKLVFTAILTAVCVSAAAPQGKPGDHPAIQEYLSHPGFIWQCQRSGHFEFCFDPKLKRDPNLIEVRKGAEQARTHILRLAGATKYKPVIHVFFLESRARMKELIGYDGEGRARPTQHVVFFVLSPVRPDLTHELCHEIMSNLWGAAETWIEEGVATYAAEGGFHSDVQAWLAAGTLLPLAQLVNPDWDPSQGSQQFTYSELAGFVEYLKNTYGLSSVRQIWRFGSQGIPGVFGKSLNELETDWHEALRPKPLPK
jgi:hypothetical protein